MLDNNDFRFAATAFIIVTLSISAAYGSGIETVKIGVAAPLTGPQAQFGKDFQSGAVLAVEQVNATKPKIGDKEVTFVIDSQDDQADPKTGTVVAQKLVDEGVKGVIGHVNSGVSIPASAIYSRAGIPQISVSTSPAYTKQGLKTTFRAATSDIQQGTAMGEYAIKELAAKRIVIVDDRTAYGQGLAEQFELGVKHAGGSVLDHQYVSDKSIDFRAILTTIKALNPDLIYYAGSDPQSAPLFKQARGLALSAKFASGDMSKTDTFIKVAGTAAEGTVVSLSGLPLSKMPGGSDFANRFKQRFGADPSTMSPYSFDSVMALISAMETAKSSSPEVYLPILSNIDMKGVTSNHFAFDKFGDQRESFVTIYRVEQGQFVPVRTLGP